MAAKMQSASSNLNGKVLNPLIDFDFVVNTDIGLIRFIRDNFQDERAFNLDTLNKSDREILSLLYSRNNWNPLSVISTEENMSDIDELYKSFFDTYKKEIINSSTVSKHIDQFMHLVGVNGTNFGVSPTVAVNDDLEKSEFVSHYSGFTFIEKTDKASISTKDPFYIKDYRLFTNVGLENISHRKIYMLPLQYSIDYFENNNNNLTSKNVFMLMGKDYRKKGENNNGQQ